MRAPYQVLIILYKKHNNNILYGIFYRNSHPIWQFISGGGENQEIPIETVIREIKDEYGDIHLSSEHKEYKWVEYDEALKKLKYDSNKTALWELNERLKKQNEMEKTKPYRQLVIYWKKKTIEQI